MLLAPSAGVNRKACLIFAHSHEVDNVGIPAALQDGCLPPEGLIRLLVIDPVELLHGHITVQVLGLVDLQRAHPYL